MTRLSFRRTARTIRRLVVLASVAWIWVRPGMVAAAQDPSSNDVYLIVVGSEDISADFAQQLGDVLANPPLTQVQRVQIAHTGRVEPRDVFDLHRADAPHPTAWVIVDGATVHVRAAGAGREQFVFRDITTSQPMSDLDRERVGQTLRTALSAVIEGSPGALGRAQARQAMDVPEPRPLVPKPEPVEAAPPLALIPPESPPVRAEEKGPLQFHLGASLQMARFDSAVAYAPGAIGSLEWTDYAVRPRVWLSVAEFLPHTYHAPPPVFSSSVRLGIGAIIPRVPWLQFDLGAGRDLLRGNSLPLGYQTTVYRFAVRFGPSDRFGIRSSLTLAIERVNDYAIDFFGAAIGYTETATRVRPGLTLELWWL